MSPEDRISTELVPAPFLPPDGYDRTLREDFEAGPIALNDPSEGLFYQTWHLTWNSATGDFIVTPDITGGPIIVLNSPNVTQCTLAFDNNGHVNIAYTANATPYLYWYDTLAAAWVITELPAGTFCPTICLDDKRLTQTNSNDIILHYTKQQFDGTWNFYRKLQRERFLTEKLWIEDVQPFIFKLGMHEGIRIQILLAGTQTVSIPPVLPPGPSTPQANLDFELGDIYWTKTGDFVIDQTDSFAGNWSARLLGTNPSTLENNVYTSIIPEDPAFVSCVVKGSIATTIKLGFKFYNSNKSLIATEIAVKNVTTNWTQITHSLFSPANAVYMRIFVTNDVTSGIVSFDNFNFFAVTDTGTFFEVETGAIIYMHVELDALTPFEVEV